MTEGSAVIAVLRLLVSLGVVLTLVVVLARWAMKRGIGGGRGSRTGVDIELLARRGLGRGSALHVVQVGEQVLVLGVTDQQVSLIHELPAPRHVVVEHDGAPEEPVGGLDDFEAILAARSAEPEQPLALVGPMTRAERRELERSAGRRVARTAAPAAPSAGRPAARGTAQEVPAGWPWNAASLVVGALKGSRA